METAKEIKSCPFCNHKANLVCDLINEPDYFVPLYEIAVECTFCSARGTPIISKKNAVEANFDTYECICAVNAWNSRAVVVSEEE